VAWDSISPASIQKCWWKFTIIKRPDDQAEEDTASQDQQDRNKLRAQIAQLPNIIEPLSVNESVCLGSEEIEDTEVAEEHKIFEQVVERYGLVE
jgi:hypothetical protein